MDQKTYKKLYRQARDSFSTITLAEKRRIKKVYIDAANLAAEAVKASVLADLSPITIALNQQLQASLEAGANMISASLEKNIPLSISEAYGRYLNVDAMYLDDAFKAARATGLLTQAGILNMGVAVNQRLVVATIHRMYADGYSFSDRIWGTGLNKAGRFIGVNGSYQDSIKQIISMGIAQNRDTFDIAKDIQDYAAKGRDFVIKEGRYGKLIPGTAQYKRRIPKNIDWRAVRLVRSELYASLQAASLEQGRLNPASSGWYDWKLTPGAQHRCVCPKLAADSPYREEAVPAFPHPNCYIEGTEVYTKRGWIDFRNVDIDTDLFLSMKPETMEYEWVNAVNYYSFHVNESLVEMKSNSFNMVTTKNHRNYTKSAHKMRWLTSEEIHNGKYSTMAIPRTGKWEGSKPNNVQLGTYILTPEQYCQFMGYYLSEGNISKHTKGIKHFGTIAQMKPDSKKTMADFLYTLPFKVTPSKVGFYFGDESVCLDLKKIGHMCWNFKIPEAIMKMPPDMIKIFLNAYMLGDGSERKTNGLGIKSIERTLFTSSKIMADQIGELIIKVG